MEFEDLLQRERQRAARRAQEGGSREEGSEVGSGIPLNGQAAYSQGGDQGVTHGNGADPWAAMPPLPGGFLSALWGGM